PGRRPRLRCHRFPGSVPGRSRCGRAVRHRSRDRVRSGPHRGRARGDRVPPHCGPPRRSPRCPSRRRTRVAAGRARRRRAPRTAAASCSRASASVTTPRRAAGCGCLTRRSGRVLLPVPATARVVLGAVPTAFGAVLAVLRGVVLVLTVFVALAVLVVLVVLAVLHAALHRRQSGVVLEDRADLAVHQRGAGLPTLLGTRVPAQDQPFFGEILDLLTARVLLHQFGARRIEPFGLLLARGVGVELVTEVYHRHDLVRMLLVTRNRIADALVDQAEAGAGLPHVGLVDLLGRFGQHLEAAAGTDPLEATVQCALTLGPLPLVRTQYADGELALGVQRFVEIVL